MAKPKQPTANARERLLDAAGRGFRVGGFGGAGVDGLAKQAGLTSGAFYAYFGSKADAFRLALVDGLQLLRNGIERFKREHPADWQPRFVDFYFGTRMKVPLEEACALPTFTADAARSDQATRASYEAELRSLVDSIAEGLSGDDARLKAWHLMAVLAGGAGMARAVTDKKLRAEILAAVAQAARSV
jgi:AcrR family transcriptional regulator